MYNQNRILKVLKAVALLKTQPPKSVKLLANQLETTDRTLYRYLDLIKELGFEIKKDTSNRVFIAGKSDEDYAVFTKEETLFL
ncbi:MAG: HTH domain-containing protein, partial [Solirubrobacteraceae bacterium]